jgi:hypothetical protein
MDKLDFEIPILYIGKRRLKAVDEIIQEVIHWFELREVATDEHEHN